MALSALFFGLVTTPQQNDVVMFAWTCLELVWLWMMFVCGKEKYWVPEMRMRLLISSHLSHLWLQARRKICFELSTIPVTTSEHIFRVICIRNIAFKCMWFTDFTRKQRLPDVKEYFHCQMHAYSNEIFRLQFSTEFNLMERKNNRNNWNKPF